MICFFNKLPTIPRALVLTACLAAVILSPVLAVAKPLEPAELRYKQANSLYRSNHMDAALRQATILMRMQPTNSDFMIFKGRVLFAKGQVTEAQQYLKQAIATSPKYADAYKLLFITERHAENKADLATYRQQANRIFPNAYWLEDVPVKDDQGVVLADWLDRNFSRVKLHLRKHPHDEDATYRLAQLHLWAQQPDSALLILNRLLARQPRNTDLHESKSTALVQKSQQLLKDPVQRTAGLATVQRLLVSATKLNPNSEDALRALISSCHFATNDLNCSPYITKAEKTYPQALWWRDYTPQRDAEGHVDTVWLDTELQAIQNVLSKQPDDDQALFRQGQLLGWKKAYPEALASLDKLLAKTPDDTDVQATKAMVFTMQAGDVLKQAPSVYQADEAQLGQAQALLNQAIVIDPSQDSPYRLLLATCRNPHNTLDEKRLKAMAAQRFPNAFWWKDYQPLRTADGKISPIWLSESKEDLNRYITQQPEDDEAKLRLAQVSAWGKGYEEALATYNDLLAKNPNDTDAKEGKAWVMSLQAGELMRANPVKMVKVVQRKHPIPADFRPADNAVLPQAQQLLTQAIELNPKSEAAYRSLLSSCKRADNALDCTPYQTQALALFPQAFWTKAFTPKKVAVAHPILKKVVLGTPEENLSKVDPQWSQYNKDQLKEYLVTHQDDGEAKSKLATLYTWDKNYPAANALYDEILADAPQDPDALTAKARLLVYQQQGTQALALMDAIPKPLSEEGHDVVLRAYVQTQQWDKAQDTLQAATELYPMRDWRKEFQDGIPTTQQFISTSYTGELLSKGRGHWDEQALDYNLNLRNGVRVNLGANRAYRFGQQDFGLEAGVSVPVLKYFSLNTQAFAGPGNAILPRWSLSESLGIDLPYGFNANVGYGFVQYRFRHVNRLTATLEKSFGPYSLAYTLMNSHVEDLGVANAHMVGLRRSYGRRNNIGVLMAFGQGVEAIGLGNGSIATSATAPNVLRFDTISGSLNGLHYVSPNWGVAYSLYVAKLDGLFTRRGLSVGLRRAI
jgi:YaiO family outer membrane protein